MKQDERLIQHLNNIKVSLDLASSIAGLPNDIRDEIKNAIDEAIKMIPNRGDANIPTRL